MKISIVRALVLAVAMSGTIAVAAPSADACGSYEVTEEDRVRSAAYTYLRNQQVDADTQLQAVEVVNTRVATARWAVPNSKTVTHAVLLKIDGSWKVIGSRRVAQSSSSSPRVASNR